MSIRLSKITAWDLPGSDSVEQSLRHPNKLGVTNGMEGVTPGRARDHVQLANAVALTILCNNVDSASVFIVDSTQTAVDHDVEAIADVSRSP